MAFFNSAVTVLQTLVIAIGAGLGIWGVINLLEGYGNDNPGAKTVEGFRTIPVYVTGREGIVYTPPDAAQVPALVDDLLAFITVSYTHLHRNDKHT